eukprot:gene15539-20980_t
MNETLLKQWLNPLDMCMLTINDSNTDVRAYKHKKCDVNMNYNSDSNINNNNIGNTKYNYYVYNSQHLFCHIGSSLGKPCASPLSTRTYFTAIMKDFQDPNSLVLSNALQIIAKKKMPLIFIGDGISKQNQDALICEIFRTEKNKVIIYGSMRNEYSQLLSNFTIEWINSKSDKSNDRLKLEVIFLKMTHIYNVENSNIDNINGQINKYRKQRNLIYRNKNDNNTNNNSRFKKKTKNIILNINKTDVNNNNNNKRFLTNDTIPLNNKITKNNKTSKISRYVLPNNTRIFPLDSSISSAKIINKTNYDKNSVITNYRTTAMMSLRKNNISNLYNNTKINQRYYNRLGFNNTINNNIINSNNKIKPNIIRKTTNNESIIEDNNNNNNNNNSALLSNLLGINSISGTSLFLNDVNNIINQYINQYNNVVIIANVGVWYNSREKFRKELPDFLLWLNEIGKNNLVLYRETAAQHWNNTETGYFSSSNNNNFFEENEPKNGSCIPIADSTP